LATGAGAGAAFFTTGFLGAAPPAKRENVPLPLGTALVPEDLATGALTGAAFFTTAFFTTAFFTTAFLGAGASTTFWGAGFGEAPPKKPPNCCGLGAGFLATGAGAGAAFLTTGFLGGDAPPKRENVPLPLVTALVAAGLAGATGAAFFTTALGLGGGLDAPLPKREKVGDFFGTALVAAGAGGGFSVAFSAGFSGLVPKKDPSASVMAFPESIPTMSIFFTGGAFGAGGASTGSALGVGLAWLVLPPKKDPNKSDDSFLGAAGFFTATGLGLGTSTLGGGGVTFFAAGLGAPKKPSKGLAGAAFFSATGSGFFSTTGSGVSTTSGLGFH